MSDRGLTVTLGSHASGPCLLTVAGELDHHTASRLREALSDMSGVPATSLIIDLSALTYCDSTGIAVLVTAHHLTQAAGIPLALAGLGDDIALMFGILGLDRVFTFHDNVEKAVTTLAP